MKSARRERLAPVQLHHLRGHDPERLHCPIRRTRTELFSL